MEIPPFVRMKSVPVVQRDAYTLKLERIPGMTFVHCNIHSAWTPKVKRAIAKDWETLCELHGLPLYALHVPGDTKHDKFLRMFGMRWVHQYEDDLHGHTNVYKKE